METSLDADYNLDIVILFQLKERKFKFECQHHQHYFFHSFNRFLGKSNRGIRCLIYFAVYKDRQKQPNRKRVELSSP
jgi:hypothetical protein